MPARSPIQTHELGVLIRLKVVPSAKRDEIAGALGDRLKIRVSAPPEGGHANKAVCALIARALGAKPKAVTIAAGRTNPEKSVVVEGLTPEQASSRLGL